MENPPTLPPAEVERWLAGVRSGDDATIVSETSTQASMAASKAVVPCAPVWVLERHHDDWEATVGSDLTVTADCCAHGAEILSHLNPERYQMPEGTRVICIKTNHLDNLHISIQRGTWVTGDKVGEKINRVYEEHKPEAGEKVLFLFSINRQRAFCALAEMTGPWVKGENRLPGWQEAAGSFNVVGSIPVTYTHVKNVANDHFQHIHHDNPNQPITNMWNGMHFELDKGREVVKIFHKKAHFTNVLCRDKRKLYSPFDPVTSIYEIDPTVPRKYTSPPKTSGRGRGMHAIQSMSNWRSGTEQSTNKFAQSTKRIEAKPHDDWKTPTPKPRVMRRDHAPPPLQLRTPTANPPQASPSPRPTPGQIIKCIVDADGNYVPIGPSRDPAGMREATTKIQNAHYPRGLELHADPSPAPLTSVKHDSGTIGCQHSFNHDPYPCDHPYGVEYAEAAPRVMAANGSLPSPGMHSRATSAKSADTSDILRRAAERDNNFVPNRPEPEDFTSTHTSALLEAQLRDAYVRSGKLKEYEAMRRQQPSNAHDSISTMFLSEYKDWASTSEVERMRIAPVSPLTDREPHIIDSVSKNGSPSYKAFKASVSRGLRTMRQGQRALPTPNKVMAESIKGGVDRQGHKLGHGGSIDGGVSLNPSAAQPGPNVPTQGLSAAHGHSRGLSSLSGVGQLPSSMMNAMRSAGQYAPSEQGAEHSPAHGPSERFAAFLREQMSDDNAFDVVQPASRNNRTDHADFDNGSDLLWFSP